MLLEIVLGCTAGLHSMAFHGPKKANIIRRWGGSA